MSNVHHNATIDLCFIGSGISSTFTLIHLLEHRDQHQIETPLHITIVEKYDEMHTGIPYGKRSGNSVLLITSLKNFLPEPEYSKFIKWLRGNKEALLAQLKTSGGSLTEQWLEKHKDSIASNQWGNLFIPRSFFGIYLKSRLKDLVDSLSQDGKLKIEYIHAEVTNIVKTKHNYSISGEGLMLTSKKVILGIGSLPTHNIYTNEDFQQEEQVLVINQIYKPSLDDNLNRISKFISTLAKTTEHCNILVIGANASALELLYKLRDIQPENDTDSKYYFLSTHGLLPDCEIDHQKQAQYTPTHLNALQLHSPLTAVQIAEAVKLDLDAAQEDQLGAASTVRIISSAFGSLLSRLNPEELKKFACEYGNEIGRRQRCAGQHYLDVIEDLKSKGLFSHISGRFKDLVQQKHGAYHLLYEDSKTKMNKTSRFPFHVVINCIGSTKFTSDQEQIPRLLQNLIRQGLVKPNASKIGIEVNQKLECAENLHVIGPLLAGNIIDSKAVWHVEHCGRIIWLSGLLANAIAQTQYTQTTVG